MSRENQYFLRHQGCGGTGTDPTVEAGDEHSGDLSETQRESEPSGASGLFVSVKGSDDYSSESVVGNGYYVYPNAPT